MEYNHEFTSLNLSFFECDRSAMDLLGQFTMFNIMKGLQLGEYFYQEQVKPLLREGFEDTKYAAALIGSGSEILGYDDETSQDHDWGPRMQLFLTEDDIHLQGEIFEYLAHNLPEECHGYPNNWGQPRTNSTRDLANEGTSYIIDHQVENIHSRRIFDKNICSF